MNLRELKEKIDIDIDGSLARFGNMESFYIKFLKKFIDDKSFENIKEALKEKNIEKLGEEAHTLKGVSGNLGLNNIYGYSVELMRASKEKNLVEIEEFVTKLEVELKIVIEELKKLD